MLEHDHIILGQQVLFGADIYTVIQINIIDIVDDYAFAWTACLEKPQIDVRTLERGVGK